MADLPLLCVDCLQPATMQYLSPEGVPIGTLCNECDHRWQEFREKVAAMLEQATAAMAGDLENWKPTGIQP